METIQTQKEYRDKISEILDRDAGQDFLSQKDVDKVNLEILNALEKDFPNDIKIEHDKENFPIIINCYAYALNLVNSFNYVKTYAKRLYYPFRGARAQCGAQSDFVKYLLIKGYLKVTHPYKNCLVLYFDQKEPKHAGILEQDGDKDFDKIVRSRWGEHQAILRHRLGYVGKKYGTELEYYEPLSVAVSEKYFREFLETKGLVFDNVLLGSL